MTDEILYRLSYKEHDKEKRDAIVKALKASYPATFNFKVQGQVITSAHVGGETFMELYSFVNGYAAGWKDARK